MAILDSSIISERYYSEHEGPLVPKLIDFFTVVGVILVVFLIFLFPDIRRG